MFYCSFNINRCFTILVQLLAGFRNQCAVTQGFQNIIFVYFVSCILICLFEFTSLCISLLTALILTTLSSSTTHCHSYKRTLFTHFPSYRPDCLQELLDCLSDFSNSSVSFLDGWRRCDVTHTRCWADSQRWRRGVDRTSVRCIVESWI